MFSFLKQRAVKVTPEDVARMKAEIALESAREDALVTEYLNLKDRPKKMAWVAQITSMAPVWSEVLDYDDFKQWRKERDGRTDC